MYSPLNIKRRSPMDSFRCLGIELFNYSVEENFPALETNETLKFSRGTVRGCRNSNCGRIIEHQPQDYCLCYLDRRVVQLQSFLTILFHVCPLAVKQEQRQTNKSVTNHKEVYLTSHAWLLRNEKNEHGSHGTVHLHRNMKEHIRVVLTSSCKKCCAQNT